MHSTDDETHWAHRIVTFRINLLTAIICYVRNDVSIVCPRPILSTWLDELDIGQYITQTYVVTVLSCPAIVVALMAMVSKYFTEGANTQSPAGNKIKIKIMGFSDIFAGADCTINKCFCVYFLFNLCAVNVAYRRNVYLSNGCVS